MKKAERKASLGILAVVMLMAATVSVVPVAVGVTSDDTLFSDDFELMWTNQLHGVWVLKPESSINHVFEAKSDGIDRGTAIFAGDTSWKDYTLEAKIYTTDTYWGVIVRADSTGSTFYSAYLNTLGYAEIWKHTGGIWTRTKLAKIDDYTISANTWYDVKVEVSGDSISLYFKPATDPDYPLTSQASFTDPAPYSSGRIGLIFYDDEDDGGIEPDYAYYDDIVVTGSPDILFSDTFERGWTELSGKWVVKKDTSTTGVGHSLDWVYSVDRDLSPNVEAITLAGDTSWTDYTLEYRVKITEDGVEREGSAFVRADSNAQNGYLIAPVVGGSDSGDVALWKRVGGDWTKLQTLYGGITPDTWHAIKVAASGSNIKVYVDGSSAPIIDYTDAFPIPNGRIGLRLWDNRHAHFDDVCVTPIYYTVTVNAEDEAHNALAVPIAWEYGTSSGTTTTQFQLTDIPSGTSMTLTAPSTHTEGYTFYAFEHWSVDGTDCYDQSITFSVSGDVTATAHYTKVLSIDKELTKCYTEHDSISVDSSDPDGTTSNIVLEAGKEYLFVASGTWTNFGTRKVDAKYWSDDNWATYYDLLPWAGADDRQLELVIDGQRVDWGEYNPDHIYSAVLTGTGNPVALVFEMELGWYSDNVGTLEVDIYELCDPEAIPIDTKVYFDMKITVHFYQTVAGVTIEDGIGADLDFDSYVDNYPSGGGGSVSCGAPGNGKGKNEMSATKIDWTINDLVVLCEDYELLLYFHTGLNPQDKQEYTSSGPHELNSGPEVYFTYNAIEYVVQGPPVEVNVANG